MQPILPGTNGPRHRVRADASRSTSAADVRNPDPWRVAVGAAVDHMRRLAGYSLKELAAAIGRDERQVSRWLAGSERPQLDALFAVPSLRQPLVLAIAALAAADGIVIETVITVRKVA